MRRVRLSGALPILIVGMALCLAMAWVTRRSLSEAAVARWFAAQGVEARYQVTALSPTAVTLGAVSLGPAAHPEFTAERIDARIGWSLWRPRVAAVVLVAPVLQATLTRDGISIGSLDRLLPPSAKPARPLPDIDLTLVRGTLRVATPAGSLIGPVDGAGRLGNGFNGRWRIAPVTLGMSGCTTAPAGASVTLATARDAVRVIAAGHLPRLACAQGTADAVDWELAATLPQTFDRYAATVEVRAAGGAAGNFRGQALIVRADAVSPMLKGPVSGTANVQIDALQGPSLHTGRVTATGAFRLEPGTGAASATGMVTVTGGGAVLGNPALRRLSRRLAGTLAQPLYDALLAGSDAAARAFDATATVAVARDAGGLRANITAVDARAASGTRLRQAGRITVSPGAVFLAGSAALSGGGLPTLAVSGSGQLRGRSVEGNASLTAAPWSVRGAAIHELKLDARSGGGRTTLMGLVRVSGALGGGVTAQRLGVPVMLDIGPGGAAAFGAGCMGIDWARLARDTVSVGPGTARVCPKGEAIAVLAAGQLGGGGVVAPLALHGRSGNVPLIVMTAPLRFAFSGPAARARVAVAPAEVVLGYGGGHGSATVDGQLDIGAASASGRVIDALVDAPDLPVAIAAGSGRWHLTGGRLDLAGGAVRITDRITPARFEPLRIDGVSAVLVNGVIDARGSGRLAATGERLFAFTATHAFSSGRGEAAVATGALVFGPQLQPYQITEALRGVIDNVVGPVTGSGHLAWSGTTVTSRGTVTIDHVSLATASLGPVGDIAGSVAFDDLLALTTPPGQRLTIRRINPGVAVDDGIAVFRLLGPDAAAIESMMWPYAGGTLTLAPVVVRARDTSRSFVLTVDNLDAEKFLQLFEMKDLNVTGRFDGRLPLVFDGGSGRIVAGNLVAREPGGLVQYVGAVGGEDLGAGARLAFGALRRLRYHSLSLDLDGDLDGELVTRLRFSGTNETVATLGGGPLPIRATGLPFRFNVTVRAPFRALLGTASSFSDVRPLIRPVANGVQPR